MISNIFKTQSLFISVIESFVKTSFNLDSNNSELVKISALNSALSDKIIFVTFVEIGLVTEFWILLYETILSKLQLTASSLSLFIFQSSSGSISVHQVALIINFEF